MYNIKKNQIIITVLVVMIVIVGIINYGERSDEYTQNAETVPTVNPNYTSEFESTLDLFDIPDGKLTDNHNGDKDTDKEKQNEGKDEEGVNENKSAKSDEDVNQDEKTNQKDNDSKKEDKNAKSTGENSPGTAVFVDSNAVNANYFAEIKVDREQKRAKSVDNLFSLMNNKSTPSADKSKAAGRMIALQDRFMREGAAEALLKAKGYEQSFVSVDDEYVDVVVAKQDLSDTDVAKILDIVCRKTKMKPQQVNISSSSFEN